MTTVTRSWNGPEPYCVGATMIFDASGAVLALEASTPMGHRGTTMPLWPTSSVQTHALDVAVQLDASLDAQSVRQARISVVGTTNDSAMFAALFPNTVAPTMDFGGITDGFVATAIDAPGVPFSVFQGATFSGDQGLDGWCGVAGWNEHTDHISVFGFAPGVGGRDLTFSSFLTDTPNGSEALVELRTDEMPAANSQTPSHIGKQNATIDTISIGYGIPYEMYGLWEAEITTGGGITVDERGRVNVVGSTNALGYPVVGANSRPWRNAQDGVRSVIDMLPPGVGRTDGSGLDVTGLPVAIIVGADGGTTPACLRREFGRRPGESVLGFLPRMLIDYEGAAPAEGRQPNLIVDRPAPGTAIVGTFICYGLPFNPMVLYPNILPVHDIESWIDPLHWSYTSILQLPFGAEQSFRFTLGALPAGTGHRWTVQVITLLLVPMYCPFDPVPPTALDYTASPAIVFYY